MLTRPNLFYTMTPPVIHLDRKLYKGNTMKLWWNNSQHRASSWPSQSLGSSPTIARANPQILWIFSKQFSRIIIEIPWVPWCSCWSPGVLPRSSRMSPEFEFRFWCRSVFHSMKMIRGTELKSRGCSTRLMMFSRNVTCNGLFIFFNSCAASWRTAWQRIREDEYSLPPGRSYLSVAVLWSDQSSQWWTRCPSRSPPRWNLNISTYSISQLCNSTNELMIPQLFIVIELMKSILN